MSHLAHLFSFKREKKVIYSGRMQVITHTLAGRYKDRYGYRTIIEAIFAAALKHFLSIPEIAGDVPPQIREKSGQ